MPSESNKRDSGPKETFTGRDVLYREGAVALLDVQRAADALLRQGRKPSVAAIREHLAGGSPNTITPLLAKYWEKLGSRLGEGPESLERVPEALARVTELLWRRALEEARERVKLLQDPETSQAGSKELQDQVGKLSVALAEARAREGEQLNHLAALSRERESMQVERASLLALVKSVQALLELQTSRVAALEMRRRRLVSVQGRPSAPSPDRERKIGKSRLRHALRRAAMKRPRRKTTRKPK
jgi:hypothetical protein